MGRQFCVIIALLFLIPAALKAQRRLSVSIAPSLMYYQGDLSGSAMPDMRTSHLAVDISAGFRLNETFKFLLGYQRGKVSGADSLVPGHESRNIHFASPISDFRLMSYTDLYEVFRMIFPGKLMNYGEYSRKLIGPDLIFGMGMTRFNPKGEYDGQWFALQPLGTEGQFIEGGDYPEPYKRWQFNMKLGMGLGYRISPQVHLEMEFIYHFLFTDYLDDLSGAYPDYNELIKTENGDLAQQFTYGGRDGSKVPAGNLRGNPGANDGIMTMGLRFTYVFSRNQVDKLIKL